MSSDSPPIALTPIYSTIEKNAPITLHDGPLEIQQGGAVERGDGIIRYEWLPDPIIRCALRVPGFTRIDLEPAAVLLPTRSASGRGFVSGVGLGSRIK